MVIFHSYVRLPEDKPTIFLMAPFQPAIFLPCRALPPLPQRCASSVQVTGLLNATFGNAVEMIVAIQPFDQIGQGYPLVI